jgi:hypothetical protein
VSTANHPWGRVDADGTVYVRTADGERVIGSWQAGSPEEAIAFYQRKYQALETEVVLLEQRINDSDMAPAQAAATVQHLLNSITDANALGDLDGLRARLERLTEDVGDRREGAKATRRQARTAATQVKERIVAEAEQIAAEATHWKSSGQRMHELLEEWKAAPHADRATEAVLWRRLSAARNAFTNRRKAYFATLEAEREDARARKEQLVAQAVELSSSTDWGSAASAFRELMREWKAAGRADRDSETELWKRFRAAQDKFFTARAEVFSAKDAALREHAEAKQQLLDQAQALLPVTDIRSARLALRGIRERWEQIGAVPRDSREHLESGLRRVEDAVREGEDTQWRRSELESFVGKLSGVVTERHADVGHIDEDPSATRELGGARAAQVGDHGPQVSISDPPGPGKVPDIGGGGISGPPGLGENPDGGGGGPEPRPRYLKGQYPQTIPVGKPFSLLISIVLTPGLTSANLKPFDVPQEGLDVLLVAYAPELRLLSDQRQRVHVPADADSEPVMFELRADLPGPRSISITAWLGGNYLGELAVDITAERDAPPSPHREVSAEITTEVAEGAVSLVVRYDKTQNAYRFEFRDEDNPAEVTSNLAYDPGPLIEHLIADLDDLTRGRSGYSAAQAREYLVNAGAGLWSQLVPEALREQFWDRQHRIRQLTILSDTDVVPWELLYPLDAGHDAGFLVEQFPVTRAIFGWRPARTLRLRPTRFVLPEGSLREAGQEIDAMRQLLDPGQPLSEVISALTALTDLIGNGNFGLLHFACHNTYDPADGSSIKLGKVQFTPTLLTRAVIRKVLMHSAPIVFMNACRSAGFAATYNRLDGWATKFLEAGAAAFIGSLWAVSDGAAREFAEEFYSQLQAGAPLGHAVMQARQAAASQPDDPTWLAYTVYGDPRAKVSKQP